MNLSEIQAAVAEWHLKNFPLAKKYQPLLCLFEEMGELSHAHLKEEQQNRGTDEELHAKAKDAIGDILIALTAYTAKRGWSLEEIFKEVWAEVSQRDWTSSTPKDEVS